MPNLGCLHHSSGKAKSVSAVSNVRTLDFISCTVDRVCIHSRLSCRSQAIMELYFGEARVHSMLARSFALQMNRWRHPRQSSNVLWSEHPLRPFDGIRWFSSPFALLSEIHLYGPGQRCGPSLFFSSHYAQQKAQQHPHWSPCGYDDAPSLPLNIFFLHHAHRFH